LALLATPIACVHESQPAATEDAVSQLITRPFLWTMKKGGRTNYLFGTVHVGVNAERDLPGSVWRALRSSKCFVMESDETHVDPGVLRQMARLPKGKKLSDLVKPEVMRKIEKRLGPMLPHAMLESSAPWFVTLVFMQLDIPKDEPMDAVLRDNAYASRMRIAYLETWKEAMDAFASVTDQADLEDIVLHGEDSDKAEIQALIRAYRTGDEAGLAQAVREDAADEPNAARKLAVLLDGRNAKWVPRIEKETKDGGCFVAVGAGHLVGPGNLRERLEKDGYQVSR